MYTLNSRTVVSRGDLSDEQVKLLDAHLAHFDLPPTSPYHTPDKLVKVCLKCGSIAEAPDNETRDFCVDNYDLRCCGLTVVFHSKQAVLVNPDNLTIIRQEEAF